MAVFWAWAFAAALLLRNTLLPRLAVDRTPADFALPYADVTFPASDGVQLAAWTIPAGRERPWIILCHGIGANRADLLDIAAELHGGRFNLLLFDFRAHGDSAGRTTSFGWREQRDLEGALAHLGGQPEVPPGPIGVFGVSMGGAVGLLVAARDDRLRAVAVDSPYADLEAAIRHHARLMLPGVPSGPLMPFVLGTYRLRFGVWPKAVSAARAAGALGQRPLLVIRSSEDPLLPRGSAEDVYRGASGPRELWVPGGSAHLGGFGADPVGYVGRLRRFFEGAF